MNTLSGDFVMWLMNLEAYYRHHGTTLDGQIRQTTSEVGEVNEAYALHLGENPRKRHIKKTMRDVADEYADVAVTALVGILMTGESLHDTLIRQFEKTNERLAENP